MDPANAILACGGGCGIVSTGTASAGVEHFSSGVGSNHTSVAAPGVGHLKAYRWNWVSATSATRTHTFATAIASGQPLVGRFYTYFGSLPTTNMVFFAVGGGNLYFTFNTGFGGLLIGFTGLNQGGGAAWAANQWVRVDFRATMGTTWTLEYAVDGAPQTDATIAGSASTIPDVRIGPDTSTANVDLYITDMLFSNASGDYPIGDGRVTAIYPNGDRTNSAANPTDGNAGHLYSAGTDFGKGTSAATNVSAQNVESATYLSLANPLSSVAVGANYITNKAGGSTEHLVWTLEDLPAIAGAIDGVMVVATTHSATTTANNQAMKLSNAAGQTASVYSLDLSETGIAVATVMMPTAPDGGAWSVDKLNNDTFVRWGDSTDISPNPSMDGVCLEVAYRVLALPATVAATATVRTVTLSITGTPAPSKVSATATVQAVTITAVPTLAVTTVAATATVRTVTLAATAVVAPARVSATATVQAVTMAITATVVVAQVSATATVRTVTLSAVPTLAPAQVVATGTVQAVNISVSAITIVTTVAATATVQAVAISTTTTVTPGMVAATATVQVVTISLPTTVTPGQVSATASVQAVTISAISTTIVTPNAVAATATVHSVTISITAAAVPPTVAATATVQAVGISATALQLPATVAGSASVLAVTIVTARVYDPLNLTASPVGSTVTLNWDTATLPGVTVYTIFRRTPQTGLDFNPFSDTPLVDNVAALTYNDTSVPTGDYDYQVYGKIP